MSAAPAPSQPPRLSGAATVLQYTGIPASWLNKRPKLPSRNWLIFISVVSSLSYLYIDDRKKCKQIRQEYIDKVSHLAEERLGSLELPRKATVYACRSPGDEDWERSLLYFKKYVKPILVAAAVDFDCFNGTRHGILTHHISDKIKTERRIAAGIEPPPRQAMPTPVKTTPEDVKRRELEGGVIIIGRHTLKEYMEGMRKGWTESMAKVDREEALARELEMDDIFDEKTEELSIDDTTIATSSEPPTPSQPRTLQPPPKSGIFTPLSLRAPIPPKQVPREPLPPTIDVPPTYIPPQPALLLVPFINLVGFKLVPNMIVDFFYQRRKVREGAEAAYKLVMNQTREFEVSDLEFDRDAEGYYKGSFEKVPSDIEKYRKDYYKELAPKITTARALARREREPTKDEINHPPPTEVELRTERMKKETRWRGDLEGWETVRKSKPVAWDELFRGALRVYTDPERV